MSISLFLSGSFSLLHVYGLYIFFTVLFIVILKKIKDGLLVQTEQSKIFDIFIYMYIFFVCFQRRNLENCLKLKDNIF